MSKRKYKKKPFVNVMPTKLSDLENDLFYVREILIKTLTEADFPNFYDVSHGEGYGYFYMDWSGEKIDKVKLTLSDGTVLFDMVSVDETDGWIAIDGNQLNVGGYGNINRNDKFTLEIWGEDAKKIPIEYCDTTEIEQVLSETEEWVKSL